MGKVLIGVLIYRMEVVGLVVCVFLLDDGRVKYVMLIDEGFIKFCEMMEIVVLVNEKIVEGISV